jgi:hypothetical protein
MSEDAPKKNGLLQTIFASGDTTIKLLTMALIVISGGGNFISTQQNGQANRKEVDQVVTEVHQLYVNQQNFLSTIATINELNKLAKANATYIEDLKERVGELDRQTRTQTRFLELLHGKQIAHPGGSFEH